MIRREQWQHPDQPVTGPPPRQPTTHIVLHWEGVSRDSPVNDGSAWCRASQSYYLNARGYSLGYSYAVMNTGDQDGWTYEIRGVDFNNAANVGGRPEWPGNANDYTRSIIIVGPTNLPMTLATQAAVTDLAGHLPIIGHRDVGYTSCPGDTYYNQLSEIEGDTDVLYAAKNEANPTGVHVGNGVHRWWMTDHDWNNRSGKVRYEWLGTISADTIRTLGQD